MRPTLKARGAGGRFLRGDEAMLNKLRKIAKRTTDIVPAALYMEAERIMSISKSKYVPYDLHTLQKSGTVELPKKIGGRWTVTMYYGGAASAYALAVHEHPSIHSPYSWRMARGKGGKFRAVQFHPAGRGPKYLETPFRLAKVGMANRIAAKIHAVFSA